MRPTHSLAARRVGDVRVVAPSLRPTTGVVGDEAGCAHAPEGSRDVAGRCVALLLGGSVAPLIDHPFEVVGVLKGVRAFDHPSQVRQSSCTLPHLGHEDARRELLRLRRLR